MSDQVADASEEILEGAAEVAEGVAQMAKGFSGLALSGAFVVGAGLGGAVAYFLTKRQLETKYAEKSAEEIAEARQHYYDKALAQENTTAKGSLEEIVRTHGYSTEEPEPETTSPPMAVTPPASLVEADEDDDDEEEEFPEDLDPEETEDLVPIVEEPEPEIQNAFQQFGDDNQPPGEWNWHKERAKRSPVRPYVIHTDEKEDKQTYSVVTYTYFEGDDVLSNERDEPVSAEDREKLIGEANLEKFGHGSEDPDCVYIRNDKLEMVFEIVKSPNAYAQEVHGFDPSELRHSDRRRGRRQFDDE